MKTLLVTLAILSCSFLANAQTCNENILPSTPSSRFTDNLDGTIHDNKTGLIWMRCALGQRWSGTSCEDDYTTYNWQDALNVADGYEFANYNTWYLPNIKELSSIIEVACHEPAINESLFPSTPQINHWTSTPDIIGGAFSVKVIEFGIWQNSGLSKQDPAAVRLVRKAE